SSTIASAIRAQLTGTALLASGVPTAVQFGDGNDTLVMQAGAINGHVEQGGGRDSLTMIGGTIPRVAFFRECMADCSPQESRFYIWARLTGDRPDISDSLISRSDALIVGNLP